MEQTFPILNYKKLQPDGKKENIFVFLTFSFNYDNKTTLIN